MAALDDETDYPPFPSPYAGQVQASRESAMATWPVRHGAAPAERPEPVWQCARRRIPTVRSELLADIDPQAADAFALPRRNAELQIHRPVEQQFGT